MRTPLAWFTDKLFPRPIARLPIVDYVRADDVEAFYGSGTWVRARWFPATPWGPETQAKQAEFEERYRAQMRIDHALRRGDVQLGPDYDDVPPRPYSFGFTYRGELTDLEAQWQAERDRAAEVMGQDFEWSDFDGGRRPETREGREGRD